MAGMGASQLRQEAKRDVSMRGMAPEQVAHGAGLLTFPCHHSPLPRSIAMIHRQSRGQLPLFVQGLEAFKRLKVGRWEGLVRVVMVLVCSSLFQVCYAAATRCHSAAHHGVIIIHPPQAGDKVLVAEACNHNRITDVCNDIGMVQVGGGSRGSGAGRVPACVCPCSRQALPWLPAHLHPFAPSTCQMSHTHLPPSPAAPCRPLPRSPPRWRRRAGGE